FSILVLMAIITTLMASPLFEWVYGKKARQRGELGRLDEADAALSVVGSLRQPGFN
ncbi:MAG: cation:proton antiporter, partial [Caulobacteraceae bacterium]